MAGTADGYDGTMVEADMLQYGASKAGGWRFWTHDDPPTRRGDAR